MHHWKLFAGWWLLLFGLYLLLTGTVSAAEICAGVACAFCAAMAVTVVRGQCSKHFKVKASWVQPVVRACLKMFHDSALVICAIFQRMFRKRSTGGFEKLEFNPGGNHALARTRRALVIAALSFAPNRFVVGLDHEHGALLAHELVPTPQTPRDKDWPI